MHTRTTAFAVSRKIYEMHWRLESSKSSLKLSMAPNVDTGMQEPRFIANSE